MYVVLVHALTAVHTCCYCARCSARCCGVTRDCVLQYGYRMSKAAANMAALTLARDLHDEGVAVGILHPGAVSIYWGLFI